MNHKNGTCDQRNGEYFQLLHLTRPGSNACHEEIKKEEEEEEEGKGEGEISTFRTSQPFRVQSTRQSRGSISPSSFRHFQ